MAEGEDIGAIIGGSIAGAAVIIIIVAILIYLLCGRRRHKKHGDQKKFRQLSPHISPVHSQPSTLGHVHNVDTRLPKVGSNGLWVGTPSIYASTPSPAYFYGRQGKSHPLMQPAVMQRTNSDTRLLPLGQVASSPTEYPKGTSQQRIYHSQGIPSPLSPVYEVRDPRNGSVYDVYQIGGGSTSRLLQDDGTSGDRYSKRLQRSQSDLVTDPSRRPYRGKFVNAESRPSSARTGRQIAGTSQVGRTGGLENLAFSESTEKITNSAEKVAVNASATDSMKLLAKNKTDDQKTVVHSSHSSAVGDKSAVSTTSANNPSVEPPLHYTYQGDIYAIPDKDALKTRSTLTDVSSAQSGAREAFVKGTSPVMDKADNAETLVIVHRQSEPEADTVYNQIYEDVGDVLCDRENITVSRNSQRSAVNCPGAAAPDGPERDSSCSASITVVSQGQAYRGMAAASAARSAKESGASEVSEEQSFKKRPLDLQLSSDTEGTTDDHSKAGKHISVTAEAFEFLDKYLSDEEGGDIHSPPTSPPLSGHLEFK